MISFTKTDEGFTADVSFFLELNAHMLHSSPHFYTHYKQPTSGSIDSKQFGKCKNSSQYVNSVTNFVNIYYFWHKEEYFVWVNMELIYNTDLGVTFLIDFIGKTLVNKTIKVLNYDDQIIIWKM